MRMMYREIIKITMMSRKEEHSVAVLYLVIVTCPLSQINKQAVGLHNISLSLSISGPDNEINLAWLPPKSLPLRCD